MEVRVYRFDKKTNSTKKPVAEGTSLDVTLKNGCDIYNPVLLINTTSNLFDNPYNYAKIYDRYYFIRDIKSIRQDLWELHLDVDVLATFKDDILSNTCLVEFDETVNTTIADSRLPVKSAPVKTGNIVSMRSIMREGGTFLFGVNGKGSINTFAFTSMDTINDITDSIGDWADALFDGVDLSLEGLCDAAVRFFKQSATAGSANNNIRSCLWIPWAINTVAVKPVVIGNYDTGYTGYTITTRTVTHNFNVAIPWQFDDWRNKSPYSNVYLYIPYIGFMSYTADELNGSSTLTIQFSIDQITGSVSAVVKCGEYIIGAYGGSSGITVPIGMSNVSPQQVLGSVAGSVSSLAVGNAVGMGASLLTGLTSVISPMATSIGSFGNGSGATQPEAIACYVYTHDIPASPSSYAEVIGTPSYVCKKLSTLSGYVKTGNASIAVTGASATEIEKINAIVNGGFFVE